MKGYCTSHCTTTDPKPSKGIAYIWEERAKGVERSIHHPGK